MEAARAWGVPRSVFLGRAVTPGEPLWLAEDRWWALALLEVEAGTCPDCSQPLAESTDGDNEFAYDAKAHICFGCTAAAQRSRAVQDRNDQPPDGLKLSVFRRR